MLAVAAAAWPFWWPFLRAVVAEIRAADRGVPEPAARPRPRPSRLVNPGWDDAHVRVPRHARPGLSRAARRAGP